MLTAIETVLRQLVCRVPHGVCEQTVPSPDSPVRLPLMKQERHVRSACSADNRYHLALCMYRSCVIPDGQERGYPARATQSLRSG